MIDKAALRTPSYGVYIVCTRAGEKLAGCVINTFMQVTSSPLCVSIVINRENFTQQAIHESGRFCVSVLSQDAPAGLIGRFGFKSSADVDKFADTEYVITEDGMPCVTEGCVAFVCANVEKEIDVGTHTIFIGNVCEAGVLADKTPMTYAYYHQVKGGKTPPKAPSYEGESDAVPTSSGKPAEKKAGGRTAWRCTLCGYIVYTDELPQDFTCPVCGMGAEVFERISV